LAPSHRINKAVFQSPFKLVICLGKTFQVGFSIFCVSFGSICFKIYQIVRCFAFG